MLKRRVTTQRSLVLKQTLCFKRLYNQFTPISRLPLEILFIIFQHLTTDRSFFEHGNPKYHPSLCWIPEITHVCHSWRNAALEMSSLWSKVSVTASTTWALEFIKRSKNSPIHLTTTYCADNDRQSAINECTRHLLQKFATRIETIAVDEIDCSDIPSFLSLISCGEGPIPLLRQFRVVVTRTPGRPQETFFFTDDNMRAPALQKLTLSGCSIDWNAVSLLRNLCHLYIMDIDFVLLANIDVILEALVLMPTLTRLALQSCIFRYSVFSPATRRASLPSLRVISLMAPSQEWLSSFLQNITFDRARDATIHLPEGTDIQDLTALFNCFMQHVQASRIHYAEMAEDFPLMTSFHFDSNAAPWHWNSESSIDFHIQHSSEFHMPPIARPLSGHFLLEGLFKTVQLVNLRELRVRIYEPGSPKTWTNLFGSLPHLHTVEIFRNELEFFAALVEGTETLSGNQGVIPFPALQSFIVFDRQTVYSDEDACFILECLTKRLKFKLPLKKLDIYFEEAWDQRRASDSCSLDLPALRKVVESVTVHLS